MPITNKGRGRLRFSTRTMLVVTGVSALLCALWIPNILLQIDRANATAEYQRLASLNSRLIDGVQTQGVAEIADQLALGANPNTSVEIVWNGRKRVVSALNLSLQTRNFDIVQCLLDAGADPNLANPQAPVQTVLEQVDASAAKVVLLTCLAKSGARINPYQFDQILELDLEDATLFAQRAGLDYGLREMCIAGDLNSIQNHLAMPIQTDLMQVRSYRGVSTLLGIALLRSHVNIADWLLESGVSTEVREIHGANAIHLAAAGNCVSLMPALVRAGCDVNCRDTTGDTPLIYAIPSADPETIAALIALGANVLEPNDQLHYPIHNAAQRYYRSHSQKSGTMEASRVVLQLLYAGADLTQLDPNGMTASEITYGFRDSFERLVSSKSLDP